MDEMESLSHTKWECKYLWCSSVFIPKCRRKILYGKLRQRLGEVFRECDSPGPGLRGAKEKLRRPTFLGSGVLRVHGGAR